MKQSESLLFVFAIRNVHLDLSPSLSSARDI